MEFGVNIQDLKKEYKGQEVIGEIDPVVKTGTYRFIILVLSVGSVVVIGGLILGFTVFRTDAGCDANVSIDAGCDDNVDVPSGQVINTTGSQYGDIKEIECYDKHELHGSSIVTCMSSNQWTAIPKCEPKQCDPFTTPEHATEPAGHTDRIVGTELIVVCVEGYYLEGRTQVVCEMNKTWSQSPVCVPVECGIPHAITNAVTKELVDTSFNNSFSVDCIEGYVLSGRRTIRCNSNGLWDTLPVCEPISCGTPTVPQYARIHSLDGITYGASVVFRCDAGFASGVEQVTCTADGTWTKYPSCSNMTGTFSQEFYVAILEPYNPNQQISLLITSDTSGTANIHIPYLGINTTVNFNPDVEFKISNSILHTEEGTVEHRGIRVTTDVDVSLVVATYPTNTYEGFLALPSSMLARQYVIASYEFYTASYRSNFLVLAIDDDTSVEIVNRRVDVKVNVILDTLDTYLYASRFKDMSETIIKSNKPIAVFSGHEATSVPTVCRLGGAEYLVEQLAPTVYFAYDFIVPSIPPKAGYVVRIYSSENDTMVNYANSTNTASVSIPQQGQFHEIMCMRDPLSIRADKPVQVILYGTCRTFASQDLGNSFMSIIPSVAQYNDAVHFTVSSSYSEFAHYIAIVSKAEHVPGLRMNGQAMGSPLHTYHATLSGDNYTVNTYGLTYGVYHITNEAGYVFTALTYGFARSPTATFAYGYILGMNVPVGG